MKRLLFFFVFLFSLSKLHALDYELYLWDPNDDNLTINIHYDPLRKWVDIVLYKDKSHDLIEKVINYDAQPNSIETYISEFLASTKIGLFEKYKAKLRIPKEIAEQFNYNSVVFFNDDSHYAIVNVSPEAPFFTKIYSTNLDKEKVFSGFGSKYSKLCYDHLVFALTYPSRIGEDSSLSRESKSTPFSSKAQDGPTLYDFIHKPFGKINLLYALDAFKKDNFISTIKDYFSNVKEEVKTEYGETMKIYTVKKVPINFMGQKIEFMDLEASSNGEIKWTYFIDFEKGSQASKLLDQIKTIMVILNHPLEKEDDYFWSQNVISHPKYDSSIVVQKFHQVDKYVITLRVSMRPKK